MSTSLFFFSFFASIANRLATISCSVAALLSCNDVNLVLELPADSQMLVTGPPPFHITNVVVLINPDWA